METRCRRRIGVTSWSGSVAKPRINPSRKQRVRCPTCGRHTTWRRVVGVPTKSIIDVHVNRYGDLCGPHKIATDEVKELAR